MATGPGPAVGLCRAGDGPAVNAVKEFLVGLGRRPRRRDDHWMERRGRRLVELNQTLCTVGANKAEVEIPSPYAGRIVDLGGAEGDTLTVGSVLVRIATSVIEAEVVAPPPSANGTARKPVLVGYGPTTPWTAAGEDRSVTARGQAAGAKAGLELVGLSQVMGSGPDGVITREDVLGATGGSKPTPEMVAVRGVQAENGFWTMRIRKQIPDAHAGVQVDCSALLRLQDRMSVAAEDESPVTPFVRTPSAVDDRAAAPPELELDVAGHHRRAADTPAPGRTSRVRRRGAARAAGARGQRCARQDHPAVGGVVARLIRDARAGTLKPSELQGSTFTVSNYGALGLDEGVPVINYPRRPFSGWAR